MTEPLSTNSYHRSHFSLDSLRYLLAGYYLLFSESQTMIFSSFSLMDVVFPPDVEALQSFTFITWKEYFSCSVGFTWMWRRFRAGEVPASWAEPAHFVVTVFHLGCHFSPFCSHLPSRDRSGLLFVLSLSRKAHGRFIRPSECCSLDWKCCNHSSFEEADASRKN